MSLKLQRFSFGKVLHWFLPTLVMLFYLLVLPIVFMVKVQEGNNFNARHYFPQSLLESSHVQKWHASTISNKLSEGEIRMGEKCYKIVRKLETQAGVFYLCLENKSKSFTLKLPIQLENGKAPLSFLSLSHFNFMLTDGISCFGGFKLLTHHFSTKTEKPFSHFTAVFHPPKLIFSPF